MTDKPPHVYCRSYLLAVLLILILVGLSWANIARAQDPEWIRDQIVQIGYRCDAIYDVRPSRIHQATIVFCKVGIEVKTYILRWQRGKLFIFKR